MVTAMRPGLSRGAKAGIVSFAVLSQAVVVALFAWSFSRARDAMIFEQEGKRQAVRAAEQEAAEALAETEAQEKSRREKARTRDTPRPIALSSLVAEYESNEIRADSQFRGRVVRLSGSVVEVSKDFTDSPYLLIAASAGSRSRVRCSLSAGATRAASGLQPGSPVTVSGKVAGFIIKRVVLTDCSIH